MWWSPGYQDVSAKITELFFQKKRLSLLSITTGRIWSLEPFFLAILCEGLHNRNDCFSEEKLKINWLEQSEEDPLVYNEGNFDDQNSSKCIIDRVSVDRKAEQFILRRNKERRLKNLANGLLDNESDVYISSIFIPLFYSVFYCS